MTTGADTTVPTIHRRTAVLLTTAATAAALVLGACTSSGGGNQNSPGPNSSSHSGASSSPSAPKTLSAGQLTVTFHNVSPAKDAHLEGPVALVQHRNVQQVSYSKATKTLTVTMKKGATTDDRQIVENLVNADHTTGKEHHKKKHK